VQILWAVYNSPSEWIDGLRDEHQQPVFDVLKGTVERLGQFPPETAGGFGLYAVGSTVVKADHRQYVLGRDYKDVDVCLVGLPVNNIIRVVESIANYKEWLMEFNDFLVDLCEANCEGVAQSLRDAKRKYGEKDEVDAEHYEGLYSRMFVAELPGNAKLDVIFSCQNYTPEQWKAVHSRKKPLWPYATEYEITSVPHLPLLEKISGSLS